MKKYRNINFKGFSDDEPIKNTSVETEVEIEEDDVVEIEVEEGEVLGQTEQETRKEESDNKRSDQGKKKNAITG